MEKLRALLTALEAAWEKAEEAGAPAYTIRQDLERLRQEVNRLIYRR